MELAEIQRLKSGAIEYMRRYMKYGGCEDEDDPDYDPDFDAGYTEEHLQACERILDQYLQALSRVADPERDAQIMAAVKTVVLDLAELNLSCKESLIETEEREQICAFIHAAANQAGLDRQGDITEEWREW
jgi:hypothetical protein